MGADIKSLRTRIKSVKSTLQLTNAMGLVASSKIRRATEAMQKSGAYAAAVSDAVSLLVASPECRKSPYMRQSEGARTRLLVIAGDRGLAGGYNANVFRLAKEYPEAQLIPIGKKAGDRFGEETLSSEKCSGADAAALARHLCEEFAAGEYDRLGILYTQYHSMLSHQAAVKWVLPLTRDENAPTRSVLFEPDAAQILQAAVPEYLTGQIVAAIRESFCSEVAARRMAMDSAGKNAQQMLDDLQLSYNQARQGTITQEITEIVAGAGS